MGERVNIGFEFACYLFVGGARSQNENDVESGQPTDGYDEYDYDGNQDSRGDYAGLFDSSEVEGGEIDAANEGQDHVDGGGEEEEDKKPVIASAHTVVYPRTMVVKVLDTGIAGATMRAPGWPVELAGGTPFHPDRYSLDVYRFKQGRSQIVAFALIK